MRPVGRSTCTTFLRVTAARRLQPWSCSAPEGTGPKRSRIGTYELVAFTRHAVAIPEANPPFDDISLRLRSIFTTIARYSTEAVLNPLETAELPSGDELPTPCLLFDEYTRPGVPFKIGKQRHGLLLCVEVHPEERAFAKINGTGELIARLQQAGHYPCSDLDRPKVV